MSIGATVRYVRAERGLSQKELADKAGVTQATISRLESGRIKELKSDTLRLLADTLNVDFGSPHEVDGRGRQQ